ncbi:MAG: hypothetical protein ACK4YP_00820 [Myxococcota bacterium]
MPLLALLHACSPSPAPADDAEVPLPPAVLSPEEAVAAVITGTQHGLPDPVELFTTYLGLLALGDEGCPGPGEQLIDTVVPLTGCTSASGVTYAGVSIVEREEHALPGQSGKSVLLGGDFGIVDLDGHTFAQGGHVRWAARSRYGAATFETEAFGTFAYGGGSPWLAAGVSAVLTMGLEAPRDGAPVLTLSGGLGTEGVDLWFEDLRFDPEACAAGPAGGAVEVRDPSGAWWTLDFGDRCDGCGALTYPGTDAGDACVDLLPLAEATTAMLPVAP